MNFKYILFDLDGTLWDFHRAEKESFVKTLRKNDITENLEHLHDSYNKINADLWKAFEQNKINANELRKLRFSNFVNQENLAIDPVRLANDYAHFLGTSTFLIDGAIELLDSLFGKVKMDAITNGLQDIQISRLKNSEIAKYFTNVTISEEVGVPKPNREIFDVAYKKLGQPPKEEIIILGDNPVSDIYGGNMFGIKTCWFDQQKKELPEEIKPDFIINDLLEFQKIVLE